VVTANGIILLFDDDNVDFHVLQLFEDNKRRAAMLERHAQERDQAEKAYKEELQERIQVQCLCNCYSFYYADLLATILHYILWDGCFSLS
jgi:hypothetical protein